MVQLLLMCGKASNKSKHRGNNELHSYFCCWNHDSVASLTENNEQIKVTRASNIIKLNIEKKIDFNNTFGQAMTPSNLKIKTPGSPLQLFTNGTP